MWISPSKWFGSWTRTALAACGAVAMVAPGEVAAGPTNTLDYYVGGSTGPWIASGTQPYGYNYSSGATAPTAVSAGFDFSAGGSFTISYLSGSTSTNVVTDPSPQYVDAGGYVGIQKNNPGSPGNYLPSPAWLNQVVGTFANSAGDVVGTPFVVGNGPTTVTTPAGAARLQLGVNDDNYSDNAGVLQMQVTGPALGTVLVSGLSNGGSAATNSNGLYSTPIAFSVVQVPPGAGPQTYTYSYTIQNRTNQTINMFWAPLLCQICNNVVLSGPWSSTIGSIDPFYWGALPFPTASEFQVVPHIAQWFGVLLPGQTLSGFTISSNDPPGKGPMALLDSSANMISFVDPPVPVPEPASMALMTLGLAAIGLAVRRRNRTALRPRP